MLSPSQTVTLFLACFAVIFTSPAFSGVCKDTKRDREGNIRVFTKVVNESSRSLDVQLTNGETTISKVLAPSGSIQDLNKNARNEDRYQVNINKGTTCSYAVDKGIKIVGDSGDKYTTWKDYACTGMDTDLLDITCEKSFKPGKDRWNTTLTIGDK